MPTFSKRSKRNLDSCDPRLQAVFSAVIDNVDCTIVQGNRGKKKQNEAYRTGHSRLSWPNSLHNKSPSMAVDVVPYPVDWNDTERFTMFAGYVLGMAASMGIVLRWGGDWDMDFQVQDNDFDDLAHFEIVEDR